MYLSAIQYLKIQKPEILIDCIVLKPNLFELAQHCNFFSDIISKKQLASNFLNFKSKQYAFIILSNHESFIVPVLISRLLKCKRYIGFKKIGHWSNKYHFMLTDKITMDCVTKESDAYLNLFSPLGINRKKKLTPFFPLDLKNKTVSKWWKANIDCSYTVGVHIGNAVGQHWKVWPYQKFKKLFTKLASSFPEVKFIAFGEPSDAIALKEVFSGMDKNTFLITDASIFNVAFMIHHCHLMVCNDGGLMHIAEAVGTQSIAIFGPTDHRIFGPENPSIIIREKLPCSPCYSLPGDHRNPGNCHNRKCLDEITVSQVFSIIKKEMD